MTIQKPRKSPARRSVSVRMPTHDDVAKRAYERFIARGATDGRAGEDWLEAERELQQGLAVTPARAARATAASMRNRS